MESLLQRHLANQHWVSSSLREPWDAPRFGLAGKLNKEARALPA